jgi:hypothetical protein
MLEKSKSWVSMRSGLIAEMTDCVKDNIFKGKFPIYSYMYTLRQFMRMNGNDKKQIDRFVESVAGNGLSTRDIELLAHGYFKGSNEFRRQIRSGNLSWSLKNLKESSQARKSCTEVERAMLTSLEVTQKYMQRLIVKFKDNRYQTGAFYAQANLLSGGILRQLEAFTKGLRDFHDQSGQA